MTTTPPPPGPRAEVAIVQRRLTHYRVPLFELMRARLAGHGLHLRVLHGTPTAAEALRDDGGTLAWAEALPTRYGAGGRLCWQPYASRVRDCALVVAGQENRLLHNLPWLLRPPARPPFAFWGHGGNLQASDPRSAAEAFKRWTTPRVHWWFAYTALSADRVAATGFARERITVLNNAIDTGALARQVELARAQPAAALRRALGLGPGPLGVFVGSLQADKRIGWLLDAAARVRARVPGFQLALAGAGPEQALVARAAAAGAGVVALGPLHGARKAALLALADLVLNPGMVGLGILDAFAAARPLVTVQARWHSPEIAYLEPGINGLMTADDPAVFADACVQLLADREQAARLAAGAAAAARRYTLQAMAGRFCDGIVQALQAA